VRCIADAYRRETLPSKYYACRTNHAKQADDPESREQRYFSIFELDTTALQAAGSTNSELVTTIMTEVNNPKT